MKMRGFHSSERVEELARLAGLPLKSFASGTLTYSDGIATLTAHLEASGEWAISATFKGMNDAAGQLYNWLFYHNTGDKEASQKAWQRFQDSPFNEKVAPYFRLLWQFVVAHLEAIDEWPRLKESEKA